MAHFRPILGDLSGSIADNTFSRNRFGPYVRVRRVPVNPNTVGQQEIRGHFANATTAWRLLSAAQRQEWNDYAAQTPKQNPLGETVFDTGFNWYVATFVFASRTGAISGNFGIAPATGGLSSILAFGISVSAATGITIAPPTPNPATGEGAYLFSWAGPFNQSKVFYKGPFPFANSVVLDDSLTYPFVAATPTIVAGQRWAFRYRLMADDSDQNRLSDERITTLIATA